METVTLVAPVTALEFIQDKFLLSGEGPFLTFYSLHPHLKSFASQSVLQYQRIHGIRPRILQAQDANSSEQGTCGPNPSFYDLAVFGGKSVRLARLNLSDSPHLEIMGPIMELSDWVLDVRWMSGDERSLLCVALAHNSALLLNTKSGMPLYHRSCSEGCLLYSALVITHKDWCDTVLIGGTVFNQLVIWKPGDVASNPEFKFQVERRLLGHSGVIFDISYEQKDGIIASASDDRSVRIWQIGKLGGSGGQCGDTNPTCLHVLYGHQARVFSVKLSCDKVFSAGEDGACLIWENSKVAQRLKGHRAGGVRALALGSESCEKEATWVATGGADGGVRLWRLQDEKEGNDEKLVDLKFPKDKTDSSDGKKTKAKQKEEVLKPKNSKDKHKGDGSKSEKEELLSQSDSFKIKMNNIRTKMAEATMEKQIMVPDVEDAIPAKQQANLGKIDMDIASIGVPNIICTVDAENSTWSNCKFIVCTDKGGVYQYNNEKWDLIWQGPLEFQSYCVMEVVNFKIEGLLVHLCAIGNISGSVQVFPIANPKNGVCFKAGSGKIHSLIWQKGSEVDRGAWLLASGSNGLVYRWLVEVKESANLELEVKKMSAFELPTCAKRWLTASVRVKIGKEVVWVCGDRRGSLLLYQDSEETEMQTRRKIDKMLVEKACDAGKKPMIKYAKMLGGDVETNELLEQVEANMLMGTVCPVANQENGRLKRNGQETATESEANKQMLKLNPEIEEETGANKPTPKQISVSSQENDKTHTCNMEKEKCSDKSVQLKTRLSQSTEEQKGMLAFGKDELMIKLTPASVLFGVHSKHGVTSVFEHLGLFYSTGRDGCVRIFQVCSKISANLQNDVKVEQNMQEFELKVLRVQRACKGMEWLEKVFILDTKNVQRLEDVKEMGTNVYEDQELTEDKQPLFQNTDKTMRLDKQQSPQEARFAIVGFHGIHFIVWDPVRQERLLSVQCGGGHRSWSLWTNKNNIWTGNGALVFIKQKKIFASERTLMEASSKIGWTLQEGIHGRGIGCVCRLGSIKNGKSGYWEVVVTGGEDTSITILAINPKNGDLKVLSVLTDHISSVRVLTAVVNQDGERKSLSALVVSAGGRAQIQCCRLLIGLDRRAVAPSCQVIQVAAHRLDELWEKKRNRHKMVKMDPETRYMSMAVLEQTPDSLTLALACSDGAVRLFSVSEVNHHIELLWESFHHQRCVLSVATCCLEDVQGNRSKLLFSAATDGLIAVWDFTSFPSSSEISPPIFTIQAHQSGINSLAISQVKMNNFHHITIASGGDDGQLTVSKIKVEFIDKSNNSDFQNQLSINLENLFCIPLAHAAPLTSLKLLNDNLVMSTSCDQRVCLWRVCNAGIRHERALCSHVADTAALVLWKEENKNESKSGSSAEWGLGEARGSGLEELKVDVAEKVHIERSAESIEETERTVDAWVLVCGQGLQLIQVRNVLLSE